MLTLAHPLWLWLLPALAAAYWLSTHRNEMPPPAVLLTHPDLSALTEEAAHSPAKQRWQTVWVFLAAALMLLGLAQPQWVGPAVPAKPEGRDIMLLVDVSTTMSIDDFELKGQRVSRLDVLKGITRQFVAARDGDRFGIIAFGQHAATLAAPSFDQHLIHASLQRLQVGIAGEATAIGEALGLALKQVRTEGRLRPILILFSDGDNTAGEMKPSEALAAAEAMGVKIYTVQIGTDLFVRPPDPNADEPTLRQLAERTEGKFYLAGNTRALETIIRDIGRLEASLSRPATRREITEWYWLALLCAAGLLLIARLLAIKNTTA